MAVRRHQALLAISMLSRIGVGMISLFVLVHGLGAADYGFLVTVIAASTIGSLLTDFGFGTQAMRDVAEAPERAGAIMTDCLRIKGVLTAVASIVAIGVLTTMNLTSELFWSSVMLFASVMALSFGDLMVVSLRGIGRYDVETRVVLIGAVFFSLVVGAVAIWSPGLWQLSAALLVARIGQAVIAFIGVSRLTPLGTGSHANLAEAWRFVRSSSPLALDTALTVLAQQIDVILVTLVLGLEASAIYQVASRLAMYFLLPAQVLAGSYIPRLAAERSAGRGTAVELAIQREFAICGLVLGLAFVAAPWAAGWLLPAGFNIPLALTIPLSIFITLRYLATAYGVILMVRRRTDLRLIGQAVSLSALLVTMPVGLASMGVVAAPWSMSLAAACTMTAYFAFWVHIRREVIAA